MRSGQMEFKDSFYMLSRMNLEAAEPLTIQIALYLAVTNSNREQGLAQFHQLKPHMTRPFFWQKEIAAFIELAAFLDNASLTRALLEMNLSLSHPIAIRTANYWATVNSNDILLDALHNLAKDTTLSLTPLKQELPPNILCNLAEHALYKANFIALHILTTGNKNNIDTIFIHALKQKKNDLLTFLFHAYNISLYDVAYAYKEDSELTQVILNSYDKVEYWAHFIGKNYQSFSPADERFFINTPKQDAVIFKALIKCAYHQHHTTDLLTLSQLPDRMPLTKRLAQVTFSEKIKTELNKRFTQFYLPLHFDSDECNTEYKDLPDEIIKNIFEILCGPHIASYFGIDNPTKWNKHAYVLATLNSQENIEMSEEICSLSPALQRIRLSCLRNENEIDLRISIEKLETEINHLQELITLIGTEQRQLRAFEKSLTAKNICGTTRPMGRTFVGVINMGVLTSVSYFLYSSVCDALQESKSIHDIVDFRNSRLLTIVMDIVILASLFLPSLLLMVNIMGDYFTYSRANGIRFRKADDFYLLRSPESVREKIYEIAPLVGGLTLLSRRTVAQTKVMDAAIAKEHRLDALHEFKRSDDTRLSIYQHARHTFFPVIPDYKASAQDDVIIDIRDSSGHRANLETTAADAPFLIRDDEDYGNSRGRNYCVIL